MRIAVAPCYEAAGWAEMGGPSLVECGVIRPKGAFKPDVVGLLF